MASWVLNLPKTTARSSKIGSFRFANTGNAAAAHVQLIVWCLPLGSHTALPGAGDAAIRSNPLPSFFVPPKAAQVLVPLRSS